MKNLVLLVVGLFLFLSAKTQNRDTVIEVSKSVLTGSSSVISNNNSKIIKYYTTTVSNFCLIDTALNCFYETKSNGQAFSVINELGEIYGLNNKNGGLSKYIDQNNYVNLAKNKRIIPHFGLELKGNKLIILPASNSRDSLNNFYIQQLVIGDSLIKVYSIDNTSKQDWCYLGKEDNSKIEYLLTAKGGNEFYEFGYFDSVFTKLDTFEFKHPIIIPNKPLAEVRAFFVKGNKLIVTGEQRAKDATHINVRIPYKFEVDLKTGDIGNIWVDTITKYGTLYSRFWPNIQFDKWGNLMVTGQANNAGFLQVIDTNNQLLIDTIFKYQQGTINATDFIYHIGGGRAILGGSYDENGSISAAVWYKKFNLKDWYLPTVSIQEQETQMLSYSVFPNPFNSNFSIEGDLNRIKSLKLFNFNGSLIGIINKSKIINLSEINNGTYILEINTQSGKTERHKIIKVKNE
jgi:hypothetical protein